MTIDREALRAWVEASCEAQGVPVAVTDAGVVASVGVLLSGWDDAGVPRSGTRSTQRLQPPSRNDPVRVQTLHPLGAGVDGGVVEDGADDRGLAI